VVHTILKLKFSEHYTLLYHFRFGFIKKNQTKFLKKEKLKPVQTISFDLVQFFRTKTGLNRFGSVFLIWLDFFSLIWFFLFDLVFFDLGSV